MAKPPDPHPPLEPAPRHLRRRSYRPFPEASDAAVHKLRLTVKNRRTGAKRAVRADRQDEEVALGRKRLVALLLVILVAVSVPALILALLLLG